MTTYSRSTTRLIAPCVAPAWRPRPFAGAATPGSRATPRPAPARPAEGKLLPIGLGALVASASVASPRRAPERAELSGPSRVRAGDR
jgi:hypothetical protein